MWIERVDVKGFKRLRGEWSLAQGLTLVTGPNEAGKSSFHELLLRILFGFSRSERRRSQGVSPKDERRPWDGSPFAANARLRDTAAGRAYAVEWDFEEHTVVVRDADTGEDLSAEVRGAREDVGIGRFLVGLDLEEFRDVCCLHQQAIEAVRSSEDLGLSLRRSVESGSHEAGVEQADERLRAYLRDELGVHAGHYGDLQGRALAKARARREVVGDQLAACEQARAEIAGLARELSQKEQERVRRADRLERARQQLLLGERDELAERLDRARDLSKQAAAAPVEPVVLAQADRDAIKAAQESVARLEREVRQLESEAGESAPLLDRLAKQRLELEREADALAPYAEADTRSEDEVRRLVSQLDAAPAPLGPPPPAPEPDARLERFREQRDRLTELARSSRARRWHAGRLAAATAILVVSAVAGALAHPAAFLGLAVALALAATVRRSDGAAAAELDAALRELGAGSLDELEASLRADEERMAEAQGALRERERLERRQREQREQLEAALRAALDEAGAPAREPLSERAAAYLAACEKRKRLDAVRSELARALAELENAGKPRRDLDERRRALEDARAALGTAYERVAIATRDLDEAANAFAELERRARVDGEAVESARRAQEALRAMLGEGTVGDLERQLEEAERRLREHRARHGELAREPGDSGPLADEVARLDAELKDLDIGIEGLKTQIGERESGLPDPAELRRELGELDHRIARMELERDAIRVAREELAKAARSAHQAFAPHLKEALVRNLPRITDGRYREATIDEQLQIKVVAPETGRLVPVGQLSRGTQDQIYLVERLEIARLLDPTTGRAPLFLDDPFARFDDRRLRYGLEILAEVAVRRQVVLFSDDIRLADLIGEVCGVFQVIELPPPGARAEIPQPGAWAEGKERAA